MIKILCLGDSLTNGARNEYYRNYPIELNYLIKKKKKLKIFALMKVLMVKQVPKY